MASSIEIAEQAESLARTVLTSNDPFTLDLPPTLDRGALKAMLAEHGTDDAWRAYDLVHQLVVFGRAF